MSGRESQSAGLPLTLKGIESHTLMKLQVGLFAGGARTRKDKMKQAKPVPVMAHQLTDCLIRIDSLE